MNETVTVDQAISKGHRMVNYPAFIIIFAILGVCSYLGIQKILPFWIFPVGLLLAYGSAWLSWSIIITKWRLWAFENVRNVNELKNRAIQEKLIGADNSFFEKTEIRSKIDNEKWSILQNKFKQDDLFQNNSNVANETIIYYSKRKNFFEMSIMLSLLGIGIYLLVKTDNYIFGSIISILATYNGLKRFKKMITTKPQIILNDNGVKTISTEFYEWEQIKNEEVVKKSSGAYFVYKHPNGVEHLHIGYYDIDVINLSKLLILYRGRNKEKKTNR